LKTNTSPLQTLWRALGVSLSILVLFALSVGCTNKDQSKSSRSQESESAAPSSEVGKSQTKTLVIVGDSLTEGYGVPKEKAFPYLVEEKLASKDISLKIINSGVSGSTSASAPSRVQWALKSKPDYLALALGANDGLRGLSTKEMKKNLGEAIQAAKDQGTKVFLFGMYMPPNMGKKYTTEFAQVFLDLSKEKEVPLLPFLLENVGGQKELNQSDGIHPNEKGHEVLAETVFKFLQEQLH